MVTAQGLVGNVVFHQSGENNRMLVESEPFRELFSLLSDILCFHCLLYILVSRYSYISGYW